MSVPRPVTGVRAVKVRPDRHLEVPDDVVTEEPMQILVAGPGQDAAPLAVTMRTPGHDFELAAGFVVTEGLATRSGVAGVDYCEALPDRRAGQPVDPGARYNHVTVRLTQPWTPHGPDRYFAASASCGTCGKATIDQISTACQPLAVGRPFPSDLIPELPDRLRAAQKTFDRTGGLHAAGLFDRKGSLLCSREDVGRHNAVDKVVGWTLLSGGTDPADSVLFVSGRVSFEIVQKAAVAGLGFVAAVSAPSSLALQAAERLGVTVAAFVRRGSYNVYTHAERVAFKQ